MPRLWDRSRQKVRTPFADLLTEYVRAHWPMTLKQLAVQVGLAPTTVQRYVNDGAVPRDPRILERISEATGIPLARLYNAAGIHIPVSPVDALYPPPPRRRERQAPPVIAERAPNTALAEAIQRIRASYHPAMAEVMVQALIARAGGHDPNDYWQTRIREEHDHDAIGTLELPAIPPVQPSAQPSAQPADSSDAAHMQSQSLITR